MNPLRTPLMIVILLLGITTAAFFTPSASMEYQASRDVSSSTNTSLGTSTLKTTNQTVLPQFIVTHQKTPIPVKAIYMTSCVAATPSWRAKLVKMIEETEINSVVIDIKDYTGAVSFPVGDERYPLAKNGCLVTDMKEFIGKLHEKRIYVIGRVQVFQDATYTKLHPELAVKKIDGTTWKDRKGITFIDVGAKQYWEHIARLALLSHESGFDEINFDYIRYPSDGDMKNIWFSQSGSSTKQDMLEQFFADLRSRIPKGSPVISADLFGMTATNYDDLNIGQVLERALPHFDFVAPMVYPSHFPSGFNGWPNPNDVPGQIIKFSMGKAVERAHKLEEIESGFVKSTSTPVFTPKGIYSSKLRPWLQDFDYGGDYSAEDVRAQIQSTYDVGLDSWMLWDPGNNYTRAALKNE